jgi:hypothetical protein
MKAHEITHLVLDKFNKLAKRLEDITDKGYHWWQSHGREPKTENPLANGNASPVTHYLRHAKLYEAAVPGAGGYLNELVYAELKCTFSGDETEDCVLRTIRRNVRKESFDVLHILDEKELSEASKSDLREWIREAIELKLVVDNGIEALTTELEKREIKKDVFEKANGNGQKVVR